MKKRILSLLLVLALVLSVPFAPFPVSAQAEGVTDAAATTCGCGCGKLFSEITWQIWEGEMSSGHFYLKGNFTQPEQISIISGEKMVLDLRGYAITTAGKSRLFSVNGYLGILDTVGGGRVTALCSNGSSYNGGIITVSDNETPNSTVELFSGTITPADGAVTPKHGGLIYIGDGATFRMHGGMLLGGKSASGYNGGAICANQATSTVDIRGGKIIGPQSGQHGAAIYGNGATVSVKNCYIEGGYASKAGGNIWQYQGSLTIENCVIAGGRAATTDNYGGGNINVIGGAKVTVKDTKIYGGWAKSNGGNLSLGNSTVTMTNCQVYGGACEGQGSNISLPILSANVTLDNCTVDGGMDKVLGTLTLKGVTKIGLKETGLDLTGNSKTVKASGLTAGSEIYVSGDGKTITGGAAYLKPALRSTLTVSGSNATVAVAADGVTAGYCPHCGKQVAWQPYGTEGATHLYLTSDMTSFAQVEVASTLVIDTAGYDITATGRAFDVTESGDLAILDSAGGSVFTGSGVNGENGGFVRSAGTLKLYGGKYVFKKATDVLPTGGGIVDNGNKAYIYNVVMDAQKFVNSASGVQGGAIRSADGKTVSLEMQGGRILGGTAYNGGAVSIGTNNTSRITGVHFVSGIAANGGNLSTRGSAADDDGKLYLTGCAFYSGEATSEYAGNLYFTRQSGTITDCYFSTGTAKKYGGNIAIGLSTNITITNSVFRNGTSSQYGGNFYVPGTSSKFTLDGCLVTNGTATAGGNIFVNNGYMTVKGGEISYGEATSGNGGNISTQTPNSTSFSVDASGNTPLICGGVASGNGGNIYAANILNLQAAQFGNGTASAGKDLYIGWKSSTVPTVTLGAGVVGDVYVGVVSNLLTAQVFGGEVKGVTANTATGLYLDTHGDCGFFADAGKLYVAKTAVIDSTGTATWYSTNEAAVAACGENSYVKLYTDDSLVLTKDLYADLNGNKVNVSGNHIFYGMDSSGDGFAAPAGSAAVTGARADNVVYAPNGYTYIADTAEGVTTYHRLDMKITGVNIRPGADGVYYTAKWYCDDVLKGKIDTYGVVASTQDMPDSNFAADAGNLWTTFEQASFVSGESKNGAVIAGILKDDGRTAAENSENGRKRIFAKAYIRFADGTTLTSGDNIHFSLYEIMKSLDRLIVEKPIQYRKYNLSARNFYEKWKTMGMGDWEFTKIPAPETDDGVIDLLMVGHSFCYYYVEELYNMAKAAGYNIRVCNLYYSGCPLSKHYDWWVNGKSNYQLFEISDETGGVKVSQNNMSLEAALAKYEWDYISLQGGTSGLLDSGAQGLFDSNKLYWESLLDYFIAQFPNAQIAWHQSWANQANEYGKEDSSLTPERQTLWADLIDEYGILVTDYYNKPAGKTVVQRINTGRAWQFCREDGYDYLCARLGKTVADMPNAGDGYHDGDIGGAQYLNACVWFEFIFGESCVGNTYRPNYKTSQTLDPTLFAKLRVEKTDTGYALTEEFVQQLQAYAHRAVELARP